MAGWPPGVTRPLWPLGCVACLTLLTAPAHAQSALSAEAARTLVDPFYEALTSNAPDQVSERLRSVTSPDWVSCGSSEICEDRDAVIARWSARGAVVPDLRWELREVGVSGDRIIVRGEGSGTPTATFLGIPPTGRSFHILAIDIHLVRDGRIVRTHHVEDWAGAMRQLREAR